jgi:hypothetical protein
VSVLFEYSEQDKIAIYDENINKRPYSDFMASKFISEISFVELYFEEEFFFDEIDFLHTNAASVPFVSKRAKDILVDFIAEEIQFIPCILKHLGGTMDYYLLNILKTTDAIDRTRSIPDFLRVNGIEFICGYSELFLKDNCPDVAIARQFDYPSFVIVRDDLARAIQDKGFTGAEFRSGSIHLGY